MVTPGERMSEQQAHPTAPPPAPSARPRRPRRLVAARRAALCLSLGLAVAACKGGSPGAAGSAGATDSAAAGAASTSPSAPSAPSSSGAAAAATAAPAATLARARLPEAEVRKVVERWLAAQNAGDFAAYQALYAAKMEGVKRVADRTWRFDRKGWLADRERMFKRPMKVEAQNVTISSAGPSAAVELEQSFAQGKFQDRGPKRLVVVKEAGGLRIAREEMLRSEVAGAARPAASGGLHLVGEIDGTRVVYLDFSADAAWGTGPLAGPHGSDPMLATRAAGKVPAPYTSWLGREVNAYAADGTLCKAKIAKLTLVGGGTPHFGTVQEWDGNPDLSDDGVPWTPAERAAAVFTMSGPYLVGELDLESSSCKAVAVIEGAAPVFYVPSKPDDVARKAALKAYRALPEYRTLQKEWKEDFAGQGEWAPDPLIEVFSGAGKRYVSVHHSIFSCGEFSGQLSVIFEDRGGKLVALDRTDAVDFRPDAVFDSNGDGRLEAIGPGGGFGNFETYLDTIDGSMQSAAEVLYTFGDCGC